MFKKILLVSVLLLAVGFGSALALTSADIDLLVSIGVISAEKGAMVKATMLGTAPAPEPVVNYGQTCGAFSKNLTLGSRDTESNSDVSDLQLFLQSKGYLETDPTGYFGYVTLGAVKKFQVANGIEASGYVGVLTKIALGRQCGSSIQTDIPASEMVASTTPSMTVLSPNGGEVIPYGDIYMAGDLMFKWKSSKGESYKPSPNFKAYIIDETGVIVRDDLMNTVSSVGGGIFSSSFIGETKIKTNTKYKIKVCDYLDSKERCDVSDNYFTISSSTTTPASPAITSVSSETTEDDIIVKVSGTGLGNVTVKLLDSVGGDYSSRIISKDLSVGGVDTSLKLRVLTIPSTYQIYVTDSAGKKSNTVKFDIKSYFVKGNDPNYPFYIGWDKRSGNEKTNTSNYFDNPRFKVNDLREYVVAGDQTTVNNWCKTVGKALGKSYISGTYLSQTNGLTEPRAYLDSDGGYTLKTISNTTYMGLITCNTGAVVVGELPTTQIIGTPTLALSYDTLGKEALLSATFNIAVSGGSDGVRINPYTFQPRFNGSSKLIYVNSQRNRLVHSSGDVTDYDIPANKTIRFQVITTAKASELFAGQYYANMVWGVGYKLTDLSLKVDIGVTPENNSSNKVTIIGETSPYIKGVSQIDKLIIIEGLRLSGVTLSSMRCGDGSSVNFVSKSTSPNDARLEIVGAINSEKDCSLQLDSNNGKSNYFSFIIKPTSPVPPVPQPVPSITVISPNGGESYKVGDVVSIKWDTDNLPSTQQLDLTLNVPHFNGTIGTTIASGVPNSGSYSWIAKTLQPFYDSEGRTTVYPDGRYKINVVCSSGGGQCGFTPNFDESNNYFNIVEKPVTSTTINLSEKFPKEVTGRCLASEYVRSMTAGPFNENIVIKAKTDVKGDDFIRINGEKVGTYYSYRDCGDIRQVGNVIKAGTVIKRIPAGTPILIEIVDSVGFESSAYGTLELVTESTQASLSNASMATVSLTWDDIVLLMKVLKK